MTKVYLDPKFLEVLETDEGAIGKHFQFTKLDGELRQLGQGSELVWVNQRLVEVSIGTLHPEHVSLVNLQIQ